MIRLAVHGHLITALGTAALVYFVSCRLGIAAQHLAAGVVFAATVLIYNLDHFFDERGRSFQLQAARRLKRGNTVRKEAFSSRTDRCLPRGWVPALIAASAAVLAYFLWKAPQSTRYLVLVGALLSSLYGMPCLPGSRRLKDLPGLKIAMVPLAVTLAVFLVPISTHGGGVRMPPLDLLTVFLLAFSSATICDMHDANEDRTEGVLTLPVALGKTLTRVLLAACHVLLALLVVTTSTAPSSIVLLALSFSAIVAVVEIPQRSVHAILADIVLLLPALLLYGGDIPGG